MANQFELLFYTGPMKLLFFFFALILSRPSSAQFSCDGGAYSSRFAVRSHPSCAILDRKPEVQALTRLIGRSIADSYLGLEYDLEYAEVQDPQAKIEALSMVLVWELEQQDPDNDVIDELIRLGARADLLVPKESCRCTSGIEVAFSANNTQALIKLIPKATASVVNDKGETLWDLYYKSITVIDYRYRDEDLESFLTSQVPLKIFDLLIERFPSFPSSKKSPLEFWFPLYNARSSIQGCHMLKNENLLEHDYWVRITAQVLRHVDIEWVKCLKERKLFERFNASGERAIHLLFSNPTLENVSPSTLAQFLDFCHKEGIDLKTPNQNGKTPRELLLKTAYRDRELIEVFNSRGITK